MKNQSYYDQLSISSKNALAWASALAKARNGEKPNNIEAENISVFDIFLGTMLEHPDDSEARALLEHFNIEAGHLLPSDYPVISEVILQHNLKRVTRDSVLELDYDANEVLQIALKLGLNTGNSNVAELRALYAALIETDNQFSIKLNEFLNKAGSSIGALKKATKEYISNYKSNSNYKEVLKKSIPFNPHPIDIPNYKADHGRKYNLLDDMIGIQDEVDAFAYLLASRGLNPPLAVGLFGNWGSGKTFFMQALKSRIEQLSQNQVIKDTPQKDVPFWKKIVQIEFNAWHYMEGELWASLVDHIFNELKLVGDKDENQVQERINHWLEKIDQTYIKIANLEAQKKNCQNELTQTKKEADSLIRKKETEKEKLDRLRSEDTLKSLLQKKYSDLQKELDPVFLSLGIAPQTDIIHSIQEAKRRITEGKNLFRELWSKKGTRFLMVLTLFIVPGIIFGLSYLDISNIAVLFSGISATLGAVLGFSRKAFNMVKEELKQLEEAAEEVNKRKSATLTELDDRIREAHKQIEDLEREIEEKDIVQSELTAKIIKSQKEIEEITPTRVLTDFVEDRVGSGDYRKHLGIPALIQKDFKQLSELIKEQNAAILNAKDTSLENNDEVFNRIILYIDDLDRCPDKHVIKVLQAVHLLLAFDLFVVVVAVDSRWLSHALTKHFDALKMDHSDNTATPDDYLEKIFQIPFWISPLNDEAKQEIIHKLLQGHLLTNDSEEVVDPDFKKPTYGNKQEQMIRSFNPLNSTPGLETTALSITRDELDFLDSLAPLLGQTPRSNKRFVNLYQLVRIIYHLNPEENSRNQINNYELFAFVLALGEGLSTIGPKLLKMAENFTKEENLGSLLKKYKSIEDPSEAERLELWLKEHAHWKVLPALDIAEAFKKVNRFLFRVGSF